MLCCKNCEIPELDICHVNGTTLFFFEIILENEDGAIDLTGADVSMDLKVSESGRSVFRFANYGDRDSDIDDSRFNEGVIGFKEIEKWEIRPYSYKADILVTFPDGKTFTAVKINFNVVNNITRI